MSRLVADRGTGDPLSLHAALLAGKKVGPDATRLLAEDHRVVLGWFDWYAQAAGETVRDRIVGKICMALRAHMVAEEEIFYPAAKQCLSDAGLVEHAIDEHEGAKDLIRRLERGDGSEGGRDETVRQLEAAIRAHVEEEEGTLFPVVRGSDLDLHEIGARVAARRVDHLFELADGGVGAIQPERTEPKEYPVMAIAEDTAREQFMLGLRNIHAAAQHCRTAVGAQERRLEQYPKLRQRLQRHLEEKDEQLKRIERIMDDFGESRSVLKEAMTTIAATVTSASNAMAGDEIIKNSLANVAMAKFEAASYETLIAFAQAAGATQALRPLQQSLSEERAMISFLEDNMRPTAIRFLQLKSEGAQASH